MSAQPDPVARVAVVRETLSDELLLSLVDDLRDDGIRFNAGKAMRKLIQGPAGEIPALHAALDSGDSQFRHFAAGVLRRRCDQDKATVTPRLLEVSIEALRSDLGKVSTDAYCTWVGPITPSSARFLSAHTAAASEMLIRQLTSTDKQQRFLSAYLLAQGGQVTRTRNPQHVARVVYELVGHLAHNKTRGDAMMATHGLFRVGEAALPILVDQRRYLDEQGRKLVDLIRMDLQQMPRTKKDLWARSAMIRISQNYHDPAVEYNLRKSPLPGFYGR